MRSDMDKVLIVGAQALGSIDAAYVWHRDVQQDQAHPLIGGDRQSRRAALSHAHPVARILENIFQNLEEVLSVVDDADVIKGRRRHGRSVDARSWVRACFPLSLARTSAPEQVDDRQQDHGAYERDEKPRQAEVVLIDRAGPDERRD